MLVAILSNIDSVYDSLEQVIQIQAVLILLLLLETVINY